MTANPKFRSQGRPAWRRSLLAIAVALGLGAFAMTAPGARLLVWLGQTFAPRAAVGGPFSLVDQTGARRTDKDFAGHPMLLFFGFTHCPDICPTTLASVGRWLDALGPEADGLRPIFVTVDPERDTPAALAEYMSAFDSRITGLTGTPAEIVSMLRTYRAYARKTEAGDVEHTAALYLIDETGALRRLISYNRPDDEIVAALRELIVHDAP
ncbi:MAG: SCO family protein [Hyphomicrobiaceae bacterium]